MNEKIGHLGMFSLPTAVLCLLPGCGDGGGGKDADAEAPDAPAEDVETEADVQPEENPGDPPAEDVVTEGDCTPSCAGRECGLDPVCGTQSCGTCAPDDVCNDATGLCETLGKDYTVVVELNRYDTYRGDHALGWTDEPVVRTILDAVHAHFDGRPRYRGLCLHADRGVALRHLVHSMSVDGSTFDVDLIWAMGSGVPEELRIESAGMTSQTFTPEPNVLYPLGFTDYQPGSTVDIIATRVIDGHGPTLVMSFVP
jgi:hypothetical protein